MRRVVLFGLVLLAMWLSSSPGWSQDEGLRLLSSDNQKLYLKIMEERNDLMRNGQEAASLRNEQFVNSERLESLGLSLAILLGLSVAGWVVGKAIDRSSRRIANAIRDSDEGYEED